jgi:hypothetical protein
MFQEPEMNLPLDADLPVNLQYFVEGSIQVFPHPFGFLLVKVQVEIPVTDMFQELGELPEGSVQEIKEFQAKSNEHQANHKQGENQLTGFCKTNA